MTIPTGQARYLLIDQLVVSQRPDLINALHRDDSECLVRVFDFMAAPTSIADAASIGSPAVIVVDSVWLHLSEFLHQILEARGCTGTRIVVASDSVDDVLRVQAAHRSLSRLLDLQDPSEVLVPQLRKYESEAAVNPSALLWASVPLPGMVTHVGETARDDIDQEILDLVSVGMQDADIAGVVHASTQTVKNRISAMLERSGYRNRTQLAWMRSNEAMAAAIIRGLRQHV